MNRRFLGACLSVAFLLGTLTQLAHAENPFVVSLLESAQNGDKKAFSLLHSLADGNDDDAQECLHRFYHEGTGVIEDDAKSFQWLQKAATNGNARAQESLGDIYERGGNMETQNYNEAVKWYGKAADRGNQDAQTHLSEMYIVGKGVKQDWQEAYFWDVISNAKSLDQAPHMRDKISGHLSAEQQSATERRAQRWLTAHASLPIYKKTDDPMYRFKMGIDDDPETDSRRPEYQAEMKRLQPLADKGDMESELRLAYMFQYGHGVKPDIQKASYWYHKAAETGDQYAQYHLGTGYDDGLVKSEVEGVSWLLKSAEQGNPAAVRSLDNHYKFDKGVDGEEAVMWFQKEARMGDEAAQLW